MFLHWGVFHLGFGCWVLVDFGPHVCRGYGTFAFLLLYILGGVSGNLTSFLHTPDLTVGGTNTIMLGPVFAIIGAWFVHQMQSKGLIVKDVSDSMFIKVAIGTVIGLVLSNAGPIDVCFNRNSLWVFHLSNSRSRRYCFFFFFSFIFEKRSRRNDTC